MPEYTHTTPKTSSGVAKAAIAIGGTALGLNLLGANGGNILGNGGAPLLARGGYAAPAVTAFEISQQVAKDYVSEKEMCLIRENSAQAAQIAMFQAEKYTDAVVAPLVNRVCALETAAAVNTQADRDFRRYVNAEFVHQPKAWMNEQIVTCEDDCCCGHRRRGRRDGFRDGCCDGRRDGCGCGCGWDD